MYNRRPDDYSGYNAAQYNPNVPGTSYGANVPSVPYAGQHGVIPQPWPTQAYPPAYPTPPAGVAYPAYPEYTAGATGHETHYSAEYDARRYGHGASYESSEPVRETSSNTHSKRKSSPETADAKRTRMVKSYYDDFDQQFDDYAKPISKKRSTSSAVKSDSPEAEAGEKMVVYLGNITRDMTNDEVQMLLGGMPGVLDIALAKHTDPMSSKTCAFIEMTSHKTADEVIDKYRGFVYNGRPLLTRLADPLDYENMRLEFSEKSELRPSKSVVPPGSEEKLKLYIGNIPTMAMPADLLNFLQPYPHSGVRMKKNPTSSNKHSIEFAFVGFKTEEDARRCYEYIQPAMFHHARLSYELLDIQDTMPESHNLLSKYRKVEKQAPMFSKQKDALLHMEIIEAEALRYQRTGSDAKHDAVSTFDRLIAGHKKEPLLGLEYISEYVTRYKHQSRFICYVCEVYVDGMKVVGHILGNKHQLKYLEKKHTILYQHINDIPGIRDQHRELEKVATEIQANYGRQEIKVVYDSKAPKATTSKSRRSSSAARFERSRSPGGKGSTTERSSMSSDTSDLGDGDLFSRIAMYKKRVADYENVDHESKKYDGDVKRAQRHSEKEERDRRELREPNRRREERHEREEHQRERHWEGREIERREEREVGRCREEKEAERRREEKEAERRREERKEREKARWIEEEEERRRQRERKEREEQRNREERRQKDEEERRKREERETKRRAEEKRREVLTKRKKEDEKKKHELFKKKKEEAKKKREEEMRKKKEALEKKKKEAEMKKIEEEKKKIEEERKKIEVERKKLLEDLKKKEEERKMKEELEKSRKKKEEITSAIRRTEKRATTCKLREMIKGSEAPMLGLSFITEHQTSSEPDNPKYTCSLCDCNCGINFIVPHITGLQHRTSFMEKFHEEEYLEVADIANRTEKRARLEYHAKLIEVDMGREQVVVEIVDEPPKIPVTMIQLPQVKPASATTFVATGEVKAVTTLAVTKTATADKPKWNVEVPKSNPEVDSPRKKQKLDDLSIQTKTPKFQTRVTPKAKPKVVAPQKEKPLIGPQQKPNLTATAANQDKPLKFIDDRMKKIVNVVNKDLTETGPDSKGERVIVSRSGLFTCYECGFSEISPGLVDGHKYKAGHPDAITLHNRVIEFQKPPETVHENPPTTSQPPQPPVKLDAEDLDLLKVFEKKFFYQPPYLTNDRNWRSTAPYMCGQCGFRAIDRVKVQKHKTQKGHYHADIFYNNELFQLVSSTKELFPFYCSKCGYKGHSWSGVLDHASENNHHIKTPVLFRGFLYSTNYVDAVNSLHEAKSMKDKRQTGEIGVGCKMNAGNATKTSVGGTKTLVGGTKTSVVGSKPTVSVASKTKSTPLAAASAVKTTPSVTSATNTPMSIGIKKKSAIDIDNVKKLPDKSSPKKVIDIPKDKGTRMDVTEMPANKAVDTVKGNQQQKSQFTAPAKKASTKKKKKKHDKGDSFICAFCGFEAHSRPEFEDHKQVSGHEDTMALTWVEALAEVARINLGKPTKYSCSECSFGSDFKKFVTCHIEHADRQTHEMARLVEKSITSQLASANKKPTREQVVETKDSCTVEITIGTTCTSRKDRGPTGTVEDVPVASAEKKAVKTNLKIMEATQALLSKPFVLSVYDWLMMKGAGTMLDMDVQLLLEKYPYPLGSSVMADAVRQTHTKGGWRCTHCNKHLSHRKAEAALHYRETHRAIAPIHCTASGERFVRWSDFKCKHKAYKGKKSHYWDDENVADETGVNILNSLPKPSFEGDDEVIGSPDFVRTEKLEAMKCFVYETTVEVVIEHLVKASDKSVIEQNHGVPVPEMSKIDPNIDDKKSIPGKHYSDGGMKTILTNKVGAKVVIQNMDSVKEETDIEMKTDTETKSVKMKPVEKESDLDMKTVSESQTCNKMETETSEPTDKQLDIEMKTDDKTQTGKVAKKEMKRVSTRQTRAKTKLKQTDKEVNIESKTENVEVEKMSDIEIKPDLICQSVKEIEKSEASKEESDFEMKAAEGNSEDKNVVILKKGDEIKIEAAVQFEVEGVKDVKGKTMEGKSESECIHDYAEYVLAELKTMLKLNSFELDQYNFYKEVISEKLKSTVDKSFIAKNGDAVHGFIDIHRPDGDRISLQSLDLSVCNSKTGITQCRLCAAIGPSLDWFHAHYKCHKTDRVLYFCSDCGHHGNTKAAVQTHLTEARHKGKIKEIEASFAYTCRDDSAPFVSIPRRAVMEVAEGKASVTGDDLDWALLLGILADKLRECYYTDTAVKPPPQRPGYWTCTSCGHICPDLPTSRYRHFALMHSHQAPYTCSTCSLRSTEEASLTAHQRTVCQVGRPVVQDIKAFPLTFGPQADFLQMTWRKFHHLQCLVCSCGFKTMVASVMAAHTSAAGEGHKDSLKPLTSDSLLEAIREWNSVVTVAANGAKAIKKYRPIEWSCKVCKTTKRMELNPERDSASLQFWPIKHYLFNHSPEPPYFCALCGFKAISRERVRRHVYKRNHGSEYEILQGESVKCPSFNIREPDITLDFCSNMKVDKAPPENSDSEEEQEATIVTEPDSTSSKELSNMFETTAYIINLLRKKQVDPPPGYLWRCTTCGMCTPTFKMAVLHYSLYHSELPPYRCGDCDFPGWNLRYIEHHLLASGHSGENMIRGDEITIPCFFGPRRDFAIVTDDGINRGAQHTPCSPGDGFKKTPIIQWLCRICDYRKSFKMVSKSAGELLSHPFDHHKTHTKMVTMCADCRIGSIKITQMRHHANREKHRLVTDTPIFDGQHPDVVFNVWNEGDTRDDQQAAMEELEADDVSLPEQQVKTLQEVKSVDKVKLMEKDVKTSGKGGQSQGKDVKSSGKIVKSNKKDSEKEKAKLKSDKEQMDVTANEKDIVSGEKSEENVGKSGKTVDEMDTKSPEKAIATSEKLADVKSDKLDGKSIEIGTKVSEKDGITSTTRNMSQKKDEKTSKSAEEEITIDIQLADIGKSHEKDGESCSVKEAKHTTRDKSAENTADVHEGDIDHVLNALHAKSRAHSYSIYPKKPLYFVKDGGLPEDYVWKCTSCGIILEQNDAVSHFLEYHAAYTCTVCGLFAVNEQDILDHFSTVGHSARVNGVAVKQAIAMYPFFFGPQADFVPIVNGKTVTVGQQETTCSPREVVKSYYPMFWSCQLCDRRDRVSRNFGLSHSDPTGHLKEWPLVHFVMHHSHDVPWMCPCGWRLMHRGSLVRHCNKMHHNIHDTREGNPTVPNLVGSHPDIILAMSNPLTTDIQTKHFSVERQLALVKNVHGAAYIIQSKTVTSTVPKDKQQQHTTTGTPAKPKTGTVTKSQTGTVAKTPATDTRAKHELQTGTQDNADSQVKQDRAPVEPKEQEDGDVIVPGQPINFLPHDYPCLAKYFWQCSICGVTYNHPKAMAHFRHFHSHYPTLSCGHCNFRAEHLQDFERHMVNKEHPSADVVNRSSEPDLTMLFGPQPDLIPVDKDTRLGITKKACRPGNLLKKYKPMVWKCNICDVALPITKIESRDDGAVNVDDLKTIADKHYTSHHYLDLDHYACNTCPFSAPTRSAMTRHQAKTENKHRDFRALNHSQYPNLCGNKPDFTLIIVDGGGNTSSKVEGTSKPAPVNTSVKSKSSTTPTAGSTVKATSMDSEKYVTVKPSMDSEKDANVKLSIDSGKDVTVKPSIDSGKAGTKKQSMDSRKPVSGSSTSVPRLSGQMDATYVTGISIDGQPSPFLDTATHPHRPAPTSVWTCTTCGLNLPFSRSACHFMHYHNATPLHLCDTCGFRGELESDVHAHISSVKHPGVQSEVVSTDDPAQPFYFGPQADFIPYNVETKPVMGVKTKSCIPGEIIKRYIAMDWVCKLCGEKETAWREGEAPTETSLANLGTWPQNHYKDVHLKAPFTCGECNSPFDCEDDIREHCVKKWHNVSTIIKGSTTSSGKPVLSGVNKDKLDMVLVLKQEKTVEMVSDTVKNVQITSEADGAAEIVDKKQQKSPAKKIRKQRLDRKESVVKDIAEGSEYKIIAVNVIGSSNSTVTVDSSETTICTTVTPPIVSSDELTVEAAKPSASTSGVPTRLSFNAGNRAKGVRALKRELLEDDERKNVDMSDSQIDDIGVREVKYIKLDDESLDGIPVVFKKSIPRSRNIRKHKDDDGDDDNKSRGEDRNKRMKRKSGADHGGDGFMVLDEIGEVDSDISASVELSKLSEDVNKEGINKNQESQSTGSKMSGETLGSKQSNVKTISKVSSPRVDRKVSDRRSKSFRKELAGKSSLSIGDFQIRGDETTKTDSKVSGANTFTGKTSASTSPKNVNDSKGSKLKRNVIAVTIELGGSDANAKSTSSKLQGNDPLTASDKQESVAAHGAVRKRKAATAEKVVASKKPKSSPTDVLVHKSSTEAVMVTTDTSSGTDDESHKTNINTDTNQHEHEPTSVHATESKLDESNKALELGGEDNKLSEEMHDKTKDNNMSEGMDIKNGETGHMVPDHKTVVDSFSEQKDAHDMANISSSDNNYLCSEPVEISEKHANVGKQKGGHKAKALITKNVKSSPDKLNVYDSTADVVKVSIDSSAETIHRTHTMNTEMDTSEELSTSSDCVKATNSEQVQRDKNLASCMLNIDIKDVETEQIVCAEKDELSESDVEELPEILYENTCNTGSEVVESDTRMIIMPAGSAVCETVRYLSVKMDTGEGLPESAAGQSKIVSETQRNIHATCSKEIETDTEMVCKEINELCESDIISEKCEMSEAGNSSGISKDINTTNSEAPDNSSSMTESGEVQCGEADESGEVDIASEDNVTIIQTPAADTGSPAVRNGANIGNITSPSGNVYICPDCEKVCKSKGGLTSHRRVHKK